MIPKLAIITEIIAPYRIPVFNALAKRTELDLHVVFLSENDSTLRQWRVYKDEIKFYYDVLPSFRQRIGRYNFLLNRGAFAILNKIGPDVVLLGGYNYLASWQVAYWAKRHRVPLLLWSESTALDKRQGRRPVEFLKARFFHLCHAFVVPGRSSTHYVKHFGIPEDRIFTAPNAVDNHFFSKLAEAAWCDDVQVRSRLCLPSRYFLYVGRVVRAKGVFEILEAYAQMDAKILGEIGLVFVGDGKDRRELMQRASQVTSGTIRFYAFTQREGLPDFYALAEALVFPSHSDTWGLVVNEAMSCGLPVIASNVAGCAADLVHDGWNGLIVPVADSSQLGAAMARIAEDAVLRKAMASRSRERIQAYSPESWAEGVVKAVESVCATD